MKKYKWLMTTALTFLILTGCSLEDGKQDTSETPDSEQVSKDTEESQGSKITENQDKPASSKESKTGKPKGEEKFNEIEIERLKQMHPGIEESVAEDDLAFLTERSLRDFGRGFMSGSSIRLGMPIEHAKLEHKGEPDIMSYQGATVYSFGKYHFSTELDKARIIRINYTFTKPIPVELMEDLLRMNADTSDSGQYLFQMDRYTMIADINGNKKITSVGILDGKW